MPSIHFLDVTNRDGVQTARTGLSKFGKVMVNYYLGRLGVAQSEIGFPFLFHEVPYVRACVALAEAGAFGDLRLSGWCRAVPADVERAVSVAPEARPGTPGLRHYNLSISTSDQMIANKFRGKLDRAAIIKEMTAAVAVAKAGLGRAGGAPGEHSIGVNAEDGSRTDDGYLLEFALAAREAGASRVRYCDTTGGDSPGRIRERFAKLASAIGIPVETHCHNDLGMAVANSVSGALGDLDAGQDAWVNTCVNGIGERSGNADLLSCILAFSYGFGISESVSVGDRLDLSWARRFGLWAAYAFGQPLPPAWPGVGRNAFAHESGIHADGALKDRGNYELYDDSVLGPFPADWHTREGRVVLTGEYGGKAGFRHVLDGLGVQVAAGEEDLVFSLVQLCASATGKPLTDDELRLIAGYPRQLALLFPGQMLDAAGRRGVLEARARSVRENGAVKVFISFDMEGVAGIVDWSQCRGPGQPYEEGRRLLLGEVNAAIDGALAGGATEIVCNDSHGTMNNLDPADLNGHATYVSGRHKPLYMMQGLDATADVVFMVGYHGSISGESSVLSHTYNPSVISHVELNGARTGESGINALVALACQAPVGLITGDQVTIDEAGPFLPDAERVVVKESFTRFGAASVHPEVARGLIADGARRAVERVAARPSEVWDIAAGTAVPEDTEEPTVLGLPAISLPAVLEVHMQTADMAEVASWVRGVERTGVRAVRIGGDDPLAMFRSFVALTYITRVSEGR